MTTLSPEAALEAEANDLIEARNTRRVLGIIGRILLAAAGLLVGAILGIVTGSAFGLFPIFC